MGRINPPRVQPQPERRRPIVSDSALYGVLLVKLHDMKSSKVQFDGQVYWMVK